MALNNDDVKKITGVFKMVFEQQVGELGLVTKEDIKHLPSKEEYFKREDEMMTELKAIREEITVQSGQLSDHSDRIENLENIHPRGKHVAVV
jgi:hypothetical protein